MSLARLVTRRPRVAPGAVAAPYVGAQRGFLVALLLVSVLEIVLIDLVLRQWPVVRVAALLVGVWGVTFVAGVGAGMVVAPHEVGRDGLRLRSGPRVDLFVPWAPVDSVAVRSHGTDAGATVVATVVVVEDAGRTVVSLPVQGRTTLEVTLIEPVLLRLARGPVAADVVRFCADDPTTVLAAVRSRLREWEAGQDRGTT